MADKEYIEREATKKMFLDDYNFDAATAIDTIPTADVVEVVRCEKCRRSRPMMFDGFYYCKRHRAVRKADAFCSFGERKEQW